MRTTELILVSGKGGTGKSAVAAALSIERARRGQTVLAIDLGSGLGLGAHLRSPALAYEPTRIFPGLWAMTLVRSAALDEYLKTQLHVPGGAPTGTITRALSVLVDTAPGVREIISIGKPVFEVARGVWDVVIVDTPSLGQFRSYLRAPTTVADLVPTGNVKRQAGSIATVLTDEDTTTVILVATPAELPILETIDAIATMKDEALCPPPIVYMNRVVDHAPFDAAALVTVPQGALREAAAHQLSVEALQNRWVDSINVAQTLPMLRGVLTPGEVAFRLADTIVRR